MCVPECYVHKVIRKENWYCNLLAQSENEVWSGETFFLLPYELNCPPML